MKMHDVRPPVSTHVDVLPLRPADVDKLHLEHHQRVDAATAAALLVQRPGASCWIPSTGEFALVTPWRHRSDLVTIHTLSAFENEPILVDEVKRLARERGLSGVILVDMVETRPPSFYERNGFHRVEDIVTYTHSRPRSLANAARAGRLRFVQVAIGDRALLRQVHEVDNASFPWLWWNSEEEFQAYVVFPGVEIWAGFLADRIVCYLGFTNYQRWSHLDRIATHPDVQGLGLGRESLLFAVTQMARRGARRVALSTQADNTRSRNLYEGMGFARTPEDDYAIYAAGLDDLRFQEMAHDCQ